MIDVRKLQPWRRADLEAIVFASQGQKEGDVAGDMIFSRLGTSIRFSVQQYDEGINAPFIALSGPGHTKLNNKEVKAFMNALGVEIVQELVGHGLADTFVRSFQVRVRYDA